MNIINHTRNKGIIILFLILITISLSSSVFALNYKILGISDSAQEDIYCNYNSQTHDCILPGGDYNITGEISPSLENINLVINEDTNFNVSCEVNTSNSNTCYIFGDNNLLDISFYDFNSIKINSKINIFINKGNLINTRIEFKNANLIINDALGIYIDKNVCLGEYYTNNYIYSFMPTVDILFDKLQITNAGKLVTRIIKNYDGYNTTCKTYSSFKDLIENEKENTIIDFELNEGLVFDKITFNDVNNNGEMNLYCQTTVDGGIYSNNNCNFKFSNLTGKLPKTISNANNYGILYVSTCGPLALPDGLDYNICKLNYIRPSSSVIDLNSANTGLTNINKVNRACASGSIADQISEYLFTSDSNIESRPIVFGTINSAITSQPLDIFLITTDGNSGLYNTKNLNQKISQISQTENTFFKLFLPNHSTDTNLLDSYLFRFKLDSNSQMGYPKIGLNYPFKIHK